MYIYIVVLMVILDLLFVFNNIFIIIVSADGIEDFPHSLLVDECAYMMLDVKE